MPSKSALKRILYATCTWGGALALACSAQTDAIRVPSRARGLENGAARRASPAAPPSLHSARVASVSAGTYGPYVARGSTGALLVWAEKVASGPRSFFSLPLSATLAPRGAPQHVAAASEELGLVVVKRVGPSARSELYCVVHASSDSAKSTISAFLLGSDGALVHDSGKLAESAGPILWLDALPSARGTIVFWASRRDERADVFATELARDGTRLGNVVQLARDALAWQTAALPDGFGLGLVQGAPGRADAGPIELQIRKDLNTPPRNVQVLSEPTAELDFDMVPLSNRLLLAWSDRREIETRIYRAVLDASGAPLAKPAPLVDAFGEQALIELVRPLARESRTYIAWESVATPSPFARTLQIAGVDAAGRASEARAELAIDDNGLPELQVGKYGLTALTLAPACRRSESCEKAENAPSYVQFDQKLNVLASEPIQLDALDGKAPNLAWGLSCDDRQCFALSALDKSPAPVFAVELTPRASGFRPAAIRVELPPPPRARSLQAVAAVDPLADLATLRAGDTTFAAYVTYFDPSLPWERLKKPAPDGRYDPPRARLEVRAFPEKRAALPAQLISFRARSVGGVALTPALAEGGALLAWSAEDAKQPQVFATLLGPDGQRLRQKMITHRKGEISDVAAASVKDGYVLAWIDERSGDAEVYAAKLGPNLEPLGKERRLTNAAGAATQVTLLQNGAEVLAVWADAREPERPGIADLYSLRLRASDLEPIAAESRLFETRAHSHSPVLARRGSRVMLAWVEDADSSEDADGFVEIAELDREGRVLDTPVEIDKTAGNPLSVAMSCNDDDCELVIAVDLGATADLEALRLSAPRRVTSLAQLAEASAQAVAPALVGSELFYADRVAERLGRVRRMSVEW